jgi:hypothetical protein
MSHSWAKNTAIGPNMLGKIKRQLLLASTQQLLDLVRCPLTREGYLRVVRSRDA